MSDPNPFDAPTQIDLFNAAGDPREDIVLAFALAECDARELQWLDEAHKAAYGRHDLDAQIKIMRKIRAIKGPVTPPCPPSRRFSSRSKFAYPRRAFATGFTTW